MFKSLINCFKRKKPPELTPDIICVAPKAPPIKIQPCPKCGGEKLIAWEMDGEWDILCDKCRFSGDIAKTREEAIELWNGITKVS